MTTITKVIPSREREDWTKDFAGKWKDDRTTEEIIRDIHKARNAGIIETIEIENWGKR